MSLTVAYSDRYLVDIGDHVFRMAKYRRTYQLLLEQGVLLPEAFVEPEPASWEDLALVHDADYLRKARTGDFRPSELAQLELPWTFDAIEGFRLIAGGTILAGRAAMASAAAARTAAHTTGPAPLAAGANIGGGFHHAFPAHGEGFCVFNDVAVAIRVLQRDGTIARAAVIDVDVHQGNGTAFTFAGDLSVFTLSIHQESNYPAVKPHGSLDVGLPDGTADREYLRAVESALPEVFASRPDLIFYVAGADPYLGDQLGGLNLTFEGLRGRDYTVLNAARDMQVPVAIVLAGGYARNTDDIAHIHAATIAEAARLARG
ncbi:MAG: histone deacetylase [Vicinamibacterales bacterium]|nr:histone deacetylase [Vicinamibacterales bacterium]